MRKIFFLKQNEKIRSPPGWASFWINYSFHSAWHWADDIFQNLYWEVIPCLLQCFLHLLDWSWLVELLNICFKHLPYIFNWIEIRRLRRLISDSWYSFFCPKFLTYLSFMNRSIVFHENELAKLFRVFLLQKREEARLVDIFNKIIHFSFFGRKEDQRCFLSWEEGTPDHYWGATTLECGLKTFSIVFFLFCSPH